MLARAIKYRLLSIFIGVAVAFLALELGAYLSLKFAPNYRVRWKPQTKKFFSKYEITESLSQLPIVNKNDTPELLETTSMSIYFKEHQGLLMPPKQQIFNVAFTDKKTGHLLWNSRVTTDKYSRRRTSFDSKIALQHVVGFGCSLTWGHGVHDDETILAYLSRNMGNASTYNVAFEGYGPAENLVRIKSENSLKEIVPKTGVGLYFYFPEHFTRFVNSMRAAGTWRPFGVELTETQPGEFESIGRVDEAYPHWVSFSRWLSQDPLLQLFDFDWPVENQTDIQRMVRVLSEIKSLYLKNTGLKNKFIVVLFPNGHDAGDLMRKALDKAAIYFIDYSTVNLRHRVEGPAVLPGDGHFTPEFNQKLAAALYKDLNS